MCPFLRLEYLFPSLDPPFLREAFADTASSLPPSLRSQHSGSFPGGPGHSAPRAHSAHEHLSPYSTASSTAQSASFCPQVPSQQPLPFLSRFISLTHLINVEISWDSVLCSVPSLGQLKASNATFVPMAPDLPESQSHILTQLSMESSTRVPHSHLK